MKRLKHFLIRRVAVRLLPEAVRVQANELWKRAVKLHRKGESMQAIIALLLGASWRTSLLGALGAALEVLIGQIKIGHLDWTLIVAAILTYMFGRVSKDHNVSNAPKPVEAKPVPAP